MHPAHHTKHLPLLSHEFNAHTFQLAQRSDGLSNGTALWLGGQTVAHYLAQFHRLLARGKEAPRAIELGSGIGLTALALSSLGWDVLATDLDVVLDTVLKSNIAANLKHLNPQTAGHIETRELDWTVLPEGWNWDSPQSITSPHCSISGEPALLRPPFDLIVSADTVYKHELITPLLRTVHALSVTSHSLSHRYPFVLLCIERRDASLVDSLLTEARDTWNLNTERVPRQKLAKCLEKGGLRWERCEWEGVEVWKLRLK